MQEIYNKLIKKIEKDCVIQNEPMSKHTTLKIGGPADLFVKIYSIEDLKVVLKAGKDFKIPVYVIGNGSNILVKDNGIRGIVVKLQMNNIEVREDEIYVEAGAMLSRVCIIAKENSLSGLEFAYGIPGTVGGAIYMNAGAYGGEIKDIVVSTTYLDESLDLKTINNLEHEFSYRQSVFNNSNNIILNTIFKLRKDNIETIEEKMTKFLQSRKEKQPLDFPNAGSTFKRGDGFITAKLIEEAGLKGMTVGSAMVSTKHAGFIVNTGNATAMDILELIDIVKRTIKDKFDKDIELEIKIFGD